MPHAVGVQVESAGFVAQRRDEHLTEFLLGLLVGDLDERLDPPVEVAVHKVRRADPDLVGPAVAESDHPRMLQEAAENRPHPDALRQAGHAGAQGADSPDDQIDVDAGPARPVERVDDVLIHNGVDLDLDHGGKPQSGVLDLALDPLDDARPDAVRRDEEPPVARLAAVTSEHVEEIGQVRAHLGIGGEQTEILVRAGRLRVVVAGADVAVASQLPTLLAHDHRRLAVCLEPHEAVDDVAPRALQHPRPPDVGLLVEAGLHLDQDHDLFAGPGGRDERVDDGGVATRAVERLLDRQHMGIDRRLLDEPLHARGERMVRVVDQDVAVA